MASALHACTPTLAVIDPRGLTVRAVAYHRLTARETPEARVDRNIYDPAGRLICQWDARLWAVHDSASTANQSTVSSLSGQVLFTRSVDAGWRAGLFGDAGQSLLAWDERDTRQENVYDASLRLLSVHEQMANELSSVCVERFIYGGPSEAATNRCGRLFEHYDPAGQNSFEAYGLQGAVLAQARCFLSASERLDWPHSVAWLEDKHYVTRWQYDATAAVIEQIDALDHIQRFEVDVAGQPHASFLDGVALLQSLRYDPAGHVESEQAGNGVVTTATWSPVDGRLQQLSTASGNTLLQNLAYQYDPLGNLVRIEDTAQPEQWFARQRINAVSTYCYDTLSQLVLATGRENASQRIGPALPGLEIFGAVDDSRWRNYSQSYVYDRGGNLTALTHDAGAGNCYRREMAVAERSNRSVFKEPDVPVDFAKAFDGCGNQQALARGQKMVWNARNQLQCVTQVVRETSAQDDDIELYMYDGSGQRIRKVRRAKTRSGEHLSDVRYLPGVEIRTQTSGEELHVVIAQAGRNNVRWLHWAQGAPSAKVQDQLRYSLSDHQGSRSLELGHNGEVISHESYYPFGGTAWWAARSAIEATFKTVRYSGKERDATGLYYYGFRYYAPWLQRWINPDPAGAVDGLNVYGFVRNNPLTYTDSNGLVRTAKENWQHLSTLVSLQQRGYDEGELLSYINSGTYVVSRGLKALPVQLEAKVTNALVDAEKRLESAKKLLKAGLSSVGTVAENTLMALFGDSFFADTDSAQDAISMLYDSVKASLNEVREHLDSEGDNITIVSQGREKRDQGFVMRADPARKIFLHLNALVETHDFSVVKTLIHESTHHAADTVDFWYLFRDLPASADSVGVQGYIDDALAVSRKVMDEGPDEGLMPDLDIFKLLLEGGVPGSIEDSPAARRREFINEDDKKIVASLENADTVTAFVLRHK